MIKSNQKTSLSIILLLALSLTLILSLNLAQAELTLNSVNQDTIYPGESASVRINLENNFDYDVQEVSFSLEPVSTSLLVASPISIEGVSQKNYDEIREDKSKTVEFIIKVSSSIEPGNYNIPYKLSYEDDNNSLITSTGVISISVSSKINIAYSISQETPIINSQDKITLKIINKGFGEIKFVNVELLDSQGYTLLSDNNVYIGSISSDDFQTASFNVIYTKEGASFNAIVTYKDFENNDKVENINFNLEVYSKKEAISLGIIKANNTPAIVTVIIIIIIVWLVWRAIKKRRKAKLKKEGI